MALPDGGRAGAPRLPLLSKMLSREVRLVGVCLLVMCGLAWWWLWRMADMGGTASSPDHSGEMAGMSMPMQMPASVDVWSTAYLGAAFAMWAIMMVAMMLPSISPLILLHAAFAKRSGRATHATVIFVLSYLALWILFAALAAIGQAWLISLGVAGEASLRIGNEVLAAGLLALAALYQLSGVKRLCLANCRSPAGFLMRHWRPGAAGAIRMGALHGSYCLGCCGLLMLLLFVGGVMNLAWVAFLSLVVLAEKYAPARLHADYVIAGLLLTAAAIVMMR